MLKPIALATALAGTLDLVFAVILTWFYGGEAASTFRYIASGPFPGAPDLGAVGAMLGVGVHYALMAIMATAFIAAAQRLPQLYYRPILWGISYGIATQVVMNFIVVQLRFDPPFPPSPIALATQMFAHIALVGVPIGLINAKFAARNF